MSDESPIDDPADDDRWFEGPGPHPLVGRQTLLVRALQVLSVTAWVCAAAGVALPGRAGTAAAAALVALLVAAPILRVGWLCARWFRRGDPRFAAVAAGLVAIVVSGGVLAAV